MKKSVFTFLAAAIVTASIFFACKKEDNDGIAVTYTTQAGSTGNSGTTAGTGTTTTTPTTNTVSVNGGAYSSATANPCFTTSGQFVLSGAFGSYNYTISFLGTPTAGNYSVVTTTPTAGQCNASFAGSTTFTGSSGVVAVTLVSGKVKATFTSGNGITASDGTSTALFKGTVQCP
ncbi:MAG: hypothetical protein ACJ76F_02955 [Bacteroidia bacterium]